jgi:hypothetical protein
MIILKHMLGETCLNNMTRIFLDFRAYGTLRSLDWLLVTSDSGQHIGLISLNCLTVEDGTNM